MLQCCVRRISFIAKMKEMKWYPKLFYMYQIMLDLFFTKLDKTSPSKPKQIESHFGKNRRSIARQQKHKKKEKCKRQKISVTPPNKTNTAKIRCKQEMHQVENFSRCNGQLMIHGFSDYFWLFFGVSSFIATDNWWLTIFGVLVDSREGGRFWRFDELGHFGGWMWR